MRKINLIIMLILLFNINSIYSQKKDMKLKNVETEVVVNAPQEKVWNVLSNFGNVGTYHSGIIASKSLNGSENEAVKGCSRECVITEGKKPIVVREKIIEIEDGEYFTYDVYDAENFPVTKMLVTFGTRLNEKKETVIYFKNSYQLKPKFLSGIMKGKIRKGGYDALIAYKHFIETGEKNVDIKLLRKKYKNTKS